MRRIEYLGRGSKPNLSSTFPATTSSLGRVAKKGRRRDPVGGVASFIKGSCGWRRTDLRPGPTLECQIFRERKMLSAISELLNLVFAIFKGKRDRQKDQDR